MSTQQAPQPITATVSATDDSLAADRPIDGFNLALLRAVDDFTRNFPPGPTLYPVTVHFSAKVKRTNPGAFDEYSVTLIP